LIADARFYGICAVLVNTLSHRIENVPKSKARYDWLKQLGDNIRRERIRQNLTQQRLAEMAELNIRNVQRIEAGQIAVLFSTMVRIKKALGASWETFVPSSMPKRKQ
jgi:ribosome-binding protein aMBF1 (putative translation factor)